MPRSFSSLRRSVSTPVSARTSVVLPWSICPAVPTIMDAALSSARGPRQFAELRDEFALVGLGQAAQIEPQRLVGETPKRRTRQRAQLAFEPREAAAFRCCRADRKA